MNRSACLQQVCILDTRTSMLQSDDIINQSPFHVLTCTACYCHTHNSIPCFIMYSLLLLLATHVSSLLAKFSVLAKFTLWGKFTVLLVKFALLAKFTVSIHRK